MNELLIVNVYYVLLTMIFIAMICVNTQQNDEVQHARKYYTGQEFNMKNEVNKS
jgi:hypothetical protein